MIRIRDQFWTIVIAVAVLGSSVAGGADIQPAKDAPQPFSPEQSAARMQLPEGFRIELVASEPLVAEPTCVAFDADGRLFVCELHGYNLEGHLDVTELNKTGQLDTKVRRIRWERVGGKVAEEAKENQYGTVKLLTDTDGDGRMDAVRVWADRISPCYGLVAARGGVIVICAPDILFLADRDGDGQAEIRETLFTGFRTDVLERGINNPRWGLDNWIYVGSGGSGGTIRGPRLPEPVEIGNTDFRIAADGSAIEPVHGQVRTFGLTMNQFGDRFPSVGRPAAYALPLPRRYLKRNPYVVTPRTNQWAADIRRTYPISRPHPWRVKRGEQKAWVEFYGKGETTNGYFTGGCGGEIYLGSLFPQSYRDNFFFCEPSQNMIHRSIMKREGAGYQAHRAAGEDESEFLASSDQWFRPVNLRVGPEGALYIVDMYREIIEDYSAIPRFLQQQYGVVKGNDRGRIWRLVSESSRRRQVMKLTDLPADQLVQALGNSNAWWRLTAQRILIERGDRSVAPMLAAQVYRGVGPLARLHALYTLDGLGELDAKEVVHALNDTNYGVRMHALRLSERWLDSDKRLLARVLSMTNDADPAVRLQLAMTLGESNDPRVPATLLHLARERGDERWMNSALLSSVYNSAGDLLAETLNSAELTSGARTVIAPLAATVGARRDVPQMARILKAVTNHDEADQIECLKGLIEGLSRGIDSVPASTDDWLTVKRLLGSKSSQVREYAVQLAARLDLSDAPEMQTAIGEAVEQALDVNQLIEDRLRAVKLLAYAPFLTLQTTVAELLDVHQAPSIQLAAISALSTSSDHRIGGILLEGWNRHTPQLRRAVLDAIFAREDRWPILLDAIEDETIHPGAINELLRRQLIQSHDPQISSRATALFDRPDADSDLQQRIDRYQRALADGRDTERGREVFAKNCLACHQIKGEGHQVGPGLGSVANKPDEAILLDILNPSGHIESEYVSYVVVSGDGRIFSGILASDSATSVTLLREKGATDTILRTDIESMMASDLSQMPSDIHKVVSPQDAANLIAYLREVFGSALPGNK